MSGLYIHIPFCHSRCVYCGFFSTTRADMTDSYVDALCREMMNRKEYLDKNTLRTIYIGGGTPSRLTPVQLEKICNAISYTFNTENIIEFTIECNPDDLTDDYINILRTLPVNRISMGIQSFDDNMLKFIGRRHNASQALYAVRRCQAKEFNNISIDLMYGLPGQTLNMQTYDLNIALKLDIPHISAYHLSYEEGTPIDKMKSEGVITAIDENLSVAMYNNVCNRLKDAGYEHYEISNFCLKGYRSIHNGSYWNNTIYLGIGAGAHSYNGTSRQWNPCNLEQYINGVNKQKTIFTREKLSEKDKINESIMLSLRTSEGIYLDSFTERFGIKATYRLLSDAKQFICSGALIKEKGCIHFAEHSLFISDDIISSLFV